MSSTVNVNKDTIIRACHRKINQIKAERETLLETEINKLMNPRWLTFRKLSREDALKCASNPDYYPCRLTTPLNLGWLTMSIAEELLAAAMLACDGVVNLDSEDALLVKEWLES